MGPWDVRLGGPSREVGPVGEAVAQAQRGAFFRKKEYRDTPLPDWVVLSQRLPEPLIFEDVPLRDA